MRYRLMDALCFLGVLLVIVTAMARAENIVFPDDAGVIDITKPPYNAIGDGKTDCTEIIQQALWDWSGRNATIYFPNGTYLISDQVEWTGRATRNMFQGQSRDGVVLKLKDRCPGYQEPSNPRAMFVTGYFPPQRFRNAVRNLTIDTGKDNPGAIGLRFNASNQGQLVDVKIRSGDGEGIYGLDMGYTGDVGPLLVKNLRVEGFQVGLYTAFSTAYQALDGVELVSQKRYGWVNDGQAIAIANLRSENTVTALLNKRGSSMLTLVGGELTGGDSVTPAIINEGGLFARDVKTTGYKVAVDNHAGTGVGATGPAIDEFTSHAPIGVGDTPARSLRLPADPTPEVPWDHPKEWVSVTKFEPTPVTLDKNGQIAKPGQKGDAVFDWTPAIQQAIDSGATTVYFPRYPSKGKEYVMLGTVHIRGNVRRIIGMEAPFREAGKTTFEMAEGAQPVVVVERFDWTYAKTLFKNATPRTLVLKGLTAYLDLGENAKCYAEDTVLHFRQARGSHLWMRQWNTEYTHEPRHNVIWDRDHSGLGHNLGTGGVNAMVKTHPGNLNDGGTLWILGMKSEGDGVLITSQNGAKTEVLGGLVYANKADYPEKKAFVVRDSSLAVSVGETVGRKQPFNLVYLQRDGEEFILKPGTAPGRSGGSMLVLATAGVERSNELAEPKADPTVAQPTGTGLTVELFSGEFAEMKSTRVGLPVLQDGESADTLRASGFLVPATSGVHRFDVTSPGARLVIDGAPLIDTFRNEARYRSATIRLDAGKKYAVRFEARRTGKPPVMASLRWDQPRGEAVGVQNFEPASSPVQAVRVTSSAAEVVESSSSPVTITIERDQATDAPLTVRFADRLDLRAAMTMRFAATGGALAGRDFAPLPDAVTIPAGQRSVTVQLKPLDNDRPQPKRSLLLALASSADYVQNGATPSVAILDDDAAQPGTGTGLSATYFAKRDFTEPLVERVDPAIAFDWNETAPVKGIDMKKGFSVRWIGAIEPQYSGNHRLTFGGIGYSALRVWVDDKQVLHFKNPGETEGGRFGQGGSGLTSVRVPLQAGTKHAIKIEYVGLSHYGQAVRMNWSSHQQFEQGVPTSQLYPAGK